MIDQYAVIGNPIAHSKSPWIHTAFANTCDEVIAYRLLESEPTAQAFSQTIRQFMAAGAKGANVTMPFKEMAWALSDDLSHRAKLAGAVNTLTFADDGSIIGDTTDGVGLVRDLTVNRKVKLQGKRVLILGAGGAVKGVVQPLLEQQPEQVHIVNRTVQRADALVDIFGEYGSVSASSYQALSAFDAFDVIINATPANFSGELPPITPAIFATTSLAYDMSYASEPTLFETWCNANGASMACNGLGMLVEQAAESFYIWRNQRPDTKQVLAKLSKSLKVL